MVYFDAMVNRTCEASKLPSIVLVDRNAAMMVSGEASPRCRTVCRTRLFSNPESMVSTTRKNGVRTFSSRVWVRSRKLSSSDAFSKSDSIVVAASSTALRASGLSSALARTEVSTRRRSKSLSMVLSTLKYAGRVRASSGCSLLTSMSRDAASKSDSIDALASSRLNMMSGLIVPRLIADEYTRRISKSESIVRAASKYALRVASFTRSLSADPISMDAISKSESISFAAWLRARSTIRGSRLSALRSSVK